MFRPGLSVGVSTMIPSTGRYIHATITSCRPITRLVFDRHGLFADTFHWKVSPQMPRAPRARMVSEGTASPLMPTGFQRGYCTSSGTFGQTVPLWGRRPPPRSRSERDGDAAPTRTHAISGLKIVIRLVPRRTFRVELWRATWPGQRAGKQLCSARKARSFFTCSHITAFFVGSRSRKAGWYSTMN